MKFLVVASFLGLTATRASLARRLRIDRPQSRLLAATSSSSIRFESTLLNGAIQVLMGSNMDDKPLEAAVTNYSQSMSINEALAAAKLPSDVINLVKSTGDTVKINRTAMDQAVALLNEKQIKAKVRLDEKRLEWQEFKDKNRKTFDQVQADIVGLASTLADLERAKIGVLSKMAKVDNSLTWVKETLAALKQAYQEEKDRNVALLNDRKKDLAKTEYMLGVLICPGTNNTTAKATLVQRSAELRADGSYHGSRTGITGIQRCEQQGMLSSYGFADPRLNHTSAALSLGGRDMLQQALRDSQLLDVNLAANEMLGLGLGYDELDDGDDDGDAKLSLISRQDPVATAPTSEGKQGSHCRTLEPDCGVLHDTFARLWGDMKDSVDELTEKMAKDEKRNEEIEDQLNHQVEELTNERGTLGATLGEVTAETNQATEDQAEREKLKDELDKAFEKAKDETTKVIHEIVSEEICGTTRVRTELVTTSLPIPASSVTDCQVSEWTEQPCSVSCGGGTKKLTREVVVAAQNFGAGCPPLEMMRPCRQFACPVDCKLSEFSSFSKCTKQCGGGVQTRIRSVLVHPTRGGRQCEPLQDTQPCNTGSCDKDCELGDWTPFTPCSQACGGGFMEREKVVLTPTKGEGTCPAKRSSERLETKSCNEFRCHGDEECKAHMDIAFALDGSGSITEKGFEVLKTFAAELSQKFRNVSFGRSAVNAGVVQFGNGHWINGSVTDALIVHPLCTDLNNITQAIKGTRWQRGFTNMGQGILKGGLLLKSSPRKDAESVLVMVTDGQPSFKRQAEEAMKNVRQHTRVVIVHVKTFPSQFEKEFVQSLVSHPAQGSYINIPGKKDLKRDMAAYVNSVLAQVCPRAASPTRDALIAKANGYTLQFEGKTCLGNSTESTQQASMHSCVESANKIGKWTSLEFEEPPPADRIPGTPSDGVPTGKCRVFTTNCTDYKSWDRVNVYGPPPE